MAKAKYLEYFELMISNNEELFEEFRKMHDAYALEPEERQEEFNKIGGKVVRVVRQWEDKLCNRSEGSGYGSYSGKLAEKFQGAVRKEFPKIDSVGITVFNISQIKL